MTKLEELLAAGYRHFEPIPRYWLCVEQYRASGRISRAWLVESDISPDAELPCLPDCMIYSQRGSGSCGAGGGCIPYPFNRMGGSVVQGFVGITAAEHALAEVDYD